jgi:hypothetical protein
MGAEQARLGRHALGDLRAPVLAGELVPPARAAQQADEERLTVLTDEITAHQGRLRAIAQAAYSREDIDEFCRRAVAAGFAAEARGELLRRGRDLIGWAVSARRQS